MVGIGEDNFSLEFLLLKYKAKLGIVFRLCISESKIWWPSC